MSKDKVLSMFEKKHYGDFGLNKPYGFHARKGNHKVTIKSIDKKQIDIEVLEFQRKGYDVFRLEL